MNYEELAKSFFDTLAVKHRKCPNFSLLKENFTKGETGVLAYLTFVKNNVTAGELSYEFGVSSARIASVLNSLEKKKYIIRIVDENDLRKVIVSITEPAKKIIEENRLIAIKKVAQIFSNLGDKDTLNYIRITNKIENIIYNDNK